MRSPPDYHQKWEWHRDILFPAEVSIRPIRTSCRKANPLTNTCLDHKRSTEKASSRRIHHDRLDSRPLRHDGPMGMARRALRNYVGKSGESLRLVDSDAGCGVPNRAAQT